MRNVAHAESKVKNKPLFKGPGSLIRSPSWRQKKRRREVSGGAVRCGARRAARVASHSVTFTCRLFLHTLPLNRVGQRGALDSPSTPEEAGGAGAPGSGLSASPCCARCRCRLLSGPPSAAAAAAPAAAVPVSGMLSIGEARRTMRVLFGRSCPSCASPAEGRAWGPRGGPSQGVKRV